MRILSWNVNGLRSVWKNGFPEWLRGSRADIVCLQEIKAQAEDMPRDLFSLREYHVYSTHAMKKGYSGVAVYSKIEPRTVSDSLGHERFDSEGRFLQLDFSDLAPLQSEIQFARSNNGNVISGTSKKSQPSSKVVTGLILIALYLPHGGRAKENLGYKLEAYHSLFRYLKKLKGANVLLAGDFNIAHDECDLAHPKENQDNIMFTPEERKQLDALEALGFRDTFRMRHKEGGAYTWWPYSFGARDGNIGWRIDYLFASESLASKVQDAFILPDVHGSDHCPVGVELKSFR